MRGEDDDEVVMLKPGGGELGLLCLMPHIIHASSLINHLILEEFFFVLFTFF